MVIAAAALVAALIIAAANPIEIENLPTALAMAAAKRKEDDVVLFQNCSSIYLSVNICMRPMYGRFNACKIIIGNLITVSC